MDLALFPMAKKERGVAVQLPRPFTTVSAFLSDNKVEVFVNLLEKLKNVCIQKCTSPIKFYFKGLA